MDDVTAADRQLFADRVRRARQMSLSERMLSGPQLFDFACEVARAGIRMQHRDLNPDAIEAELRRRLQYARALEDAA